MALRYDNFFLLVLSIAAPFGFVQYFDLSTYIIPLIILVLAIFLFPSWAFYQLSQKYLRLSLLVTFIISIIGFLSFSYISPVKLLQFFLIVVIVFQISSIPKSSIENFLLLFYRYNLLLFFIAFNFYIVLLIFDEPFHYFFINGYRFSSFAFECAEVTVIILFVLIASTQRSKSFSNLFLIPLFLITCLFTTQSNMIFIFLLSLLYASVFLNFNRYSASTFVFGILLLAINIDIVIFAEFIPSVRGGVGDMSARLLGTAASLSEISKWTIIDFLKIEYFAATRECVLASGKNNFGILNFFCDFRIYSIPIVAFLILSINKIVSSKKLTFDKKLLITAIFFSWCFLPNYTTPTLIILLFILLSLYQKEMEQA